MFSIIGSCYVVKSRQLLWRSCTRRWNLLVPNLPWWRHQMATFSALLTICAGNSSVSGELPAQRPVTRSFDVFFGLCLNKRLRKQSRGWWFETLSHPLWRYCNANSFQWLDLMIGYLDSSPSNGGHGAMPYSMSDLQILRSGYWSSNMELWFCVLNLKELLNKLSNCR